MKAFASFFKKHEPVYRQLSVIDTEQWILKPIGGRCLSQMVMHVLFLAHFLSPNWSWNSLVIQTGERKGRGGTHVNWVSVASMTILQDTRDVSSTLEGILHGERSVEGGRETTEQKKRKVEKSQTTLGGGVDKQCKHQDFHFWDFNHCDFSTARTPPDLF